MRPADVLVPNWSLSRPAAFDLKVINPLNSDSILEASMIPGSTAEKGERDKHLKNDGPCNERGWSCIPLVVEVYGGWGQEACFHVCPFEQIAEFAPETITLGSTK